MAILQKPEKESSTPPLPLNPPFLTPPPTVETSSQGPKRKRRRIQFVNYLGDHNAHGKQRKRQTSTPWAKNMINFHPFQIAVYLTL